MLSTKTQSRVAYLFKVSVLAVIYHLAARVGLQMAYLQINTSPVWPPTGIALAALLLFGYNLWPGIGIGVLVGRMFTGADINVSVGLAFGNTLEAVVRAYLLKRFFHFENSMSRIRDVVGLTTAAIFSTMISASFGIATLVFTNPIVLTDLQPFGRHGG